MSEVAQDVRIATLENQLHDLLTWKQSISFLLGIAFRAFDSGVGHSEIAQSPISVLKSNKVADLAKDIPSATTWKPRRLSIPAAVGPKATVVEVNKPPMVVEEKSKVSVEIAEVPASPISVKTSDETTLVPEKASTKVAFDILDIIERYGQNLGKTQSEESTTTKDPWLGRAKFAPKVELYVEAGLPIKMILPSFPWKSVSPAR